ncbi:MAG: glutamate--tRNA ligase, partial [Candidatus Wallbacteria bacterium]|nr:glutamate--tRNA ligase [Candidatus Wallbacteria bacterium]
MVRVRFAPSPTGYLHVGGARTALYNWLFARNSGGKFLLRIEDTDFERSSGEMVEVILDSLRWLGLSWDEDVVFQTTRLERYRQVAEEMVKSGFAYRCRCTKEDLESEREAAKLKGETFKYSGRCREAGWPDDSGIPSVIRLRLDADSDIVFKDRIHGEIKVNSRDLDDFILLRSNGSPTYNFAAVVDDSDMQITHVIRGDDHLINT